MVHTKCPQGNRPITLRKFALPHLASHAHNRSSHALLRCTASLRHRASRTRSAHWQRWTFWNQTALLQHIWTIWRVAAAPCWRPCESLHSLSSHQHRHAELTRAHIPNARHIAMQARAHCSRSPPSILLRCTASIIYLQDLQINSCSLGHGCILHACLL